LMSSSIACMFKQSSGCFSHALLRCYEVIGCRLSDERLNAVGRLSTACS